MKTNKILYSFAAAALTLGMTSCTDYLDKEPDANVSEDVAFVNFHNFQGFVEEMYNCIPDKEKCYWCTTFNWGEDEIMNTGEGDAHFTRDVDLGNYRAWSTNTQEWLYRPGSNPTSTNKFEHSLWPHAWYCIRKANIGLANLDKMTVATQEERNLIAGQLYFFRAWWYEELMQWFGGLPYIKHPIGATEDMRFPRLSFQECADSCAEDFRKAADLLPIDWDQTAIGKQTLGKNGLRVTKIAALGYLGKVMLWAASPLMEHGAQLGGKNTYNYNTEYARKAAEALGELLALVESGQTNIALAQFDYEDIYNHVRSKTATTCFSDIFYTTGQNWKMPGSCEAIFRGPSTDYNGSNWNFTKIWGTKKDKLVEHDNIIHHPTANVIDQYGMANGQPIYLVRNGEYVLNPESGWDPEHPFKNRDPRFYHDIVFDGFHYVLSLEDLSAEQKKLEYCDLYTGGAMREIDHGSSTGYFIQKLIPHQCNKGDKWYEWDHAFQCYLPYMRLADVYLMYAEARAAIATGTPDLSERPTYCPGLSAIDAINALRDRVNSADYPMEHVPANLRDTREHFIDEVRRERAVELSFEGFRWCDLQRWLLLTEPPYTVKYSHEFERLEWGNYDPNKSFEENQIGPDGKKKQDIVYSWDWFKTHDPKDARVGNFHKEPLITRRLESKHYWFPLPDKDIYLYEGFAQNPGW